DSDANRSGWRATYEEPHACTEKRGRVSVKRTNRWDVNGMGAGSCAATRRRSCHDTGNNCILRLAIRISDRCSFTYIRPTIARGRQWIWCWCEAEIEASSSQQFSSQVPSKAGLGMLHILQRAEGRYNNCSPRAPFISSNLFS